MTLCGRRTGPSPRWNAIGAVLAAVCLIVASCPWAAAADPAFPALSGRVVDAARIIDAAAAARMAEKLAAHEVRSSDQVVVATIPTLGDLTIEDYANRLYRHWALGTKEKNNGALLLIAPKERKVRIEVGYGLEGALTDAMSRAIITTAISPKFRAGDFAGGLEAGVDAMLDILKSDAEQWQRRPQIRNDGDVDIVPYIVMAVFLFIFVVMILQSRAVNQRGGPRSHRMRNGRWVTLPAQAPGGWGGGSSWGGGGFSGGGGSSGGGGASGDW